MHHCEELDSPEMGKVGRYHPVMVEWQKRLVDCELEIKNFDFPMWFWWARLLVDSGLRSQAARFLVDRENLLSPFGAYRDVSKKLRDMLNVLIYGFCI